MKRKHLHKLLQDMERNLAPVLVLRSAKSTVGDVIEGSFAFQSQWSCHDIPSLAPRNERLSPHPRKQLYCSTGQLPLNPGMACGCSIRRGSYCILSSKNLAGQLLERRRPRRNVKKKCVLSLRNSARCNGLHDATLYPPDTLAIHHLRLAGSLVSS